MNSMRVTIAILMVFFIQPAFPQVDDDFISGLKQRAEQGDAIAQAVLGHRYSLGDGVPQDDQEAIRWFRLAADQGDAGAQHDLGFMYAKGEGVPEDYVLAHMFANLIASQQKGDWRQKTVEARDMLEKLMTPEQINKAQQLSSEWKPKRSGSQ